MKADGLITNMARAILRLRSFRKAHRHALRSVAALGRCRSADQRVLATLMRLETIAHRGDVFYDATTLGKEVVRLMDQEAEEKRGNGEA